MIFKAIALRSLFLVFALIGVSGCENSKQRGLFDKAARMEHEPFGQSYATINVYRDVVRIDPSSKLGQLAQKRIDEMQSRIQSGSQHQQMLNQQRMNRYLDDF